MHIFVNLLLIHTLTGPFHNNNSMHQSFDPLTKIRFGKTFTKSELPTHKLR